MTKKQFSGFPTRMEFTPLPNLLFTTVIPQIEDVTELKVILHIFWLLYHKRGYPRFITYKELLSDNTLMAGMKGEARSPAEFLRHALNLAIEHGIVLRLTLDRDGEPEDIYFLNSESDKKIMTKIQQGEFLTKGLISKGEPQLETMPPQDIFSLYEQNIGMITPIIAEELREAEKLYPKDWIETAFREAVTLNRRSWKYIARILERWATEGKDDGKHRRDFKKEKTPDKYIKGKYGHLVKR